MSVSLAFGVYEHLCSRHGNKTEEEIRHARTMNYLNRARQSYWINTFLLAGAIAVQSKVAGGVDCSDISSLQVAVIMYLAIQFITVINISTVFYLLSKASVLYTGRENRADPLAGSGWRYAFFVTTVLVLLAKLGLVIGSIPIVADTLQDCRDEGNVDGDLRGVVASYITLIIIEFIPWSFIYRMTKRLCCGPPRLVKEKTTRVVVERHHSEPMTREVNPKKTDRGEEEGLGNFSERRQAEAY